MGVKRFGQCPVCNTVFQRRHVDRWFCSTACRFWSKVDKRPGLGPAGQCWEWRAAWNGRGSHRTGIMIFEGRNQTAPRIALQLAGVKLRRNVDACHACDNPRCVRPAHLFPGTRKANMRDASRKGKLGKHRGETHRSAKLSESMVREIRSLYAAGGVTTRALAARFGIAPSGIWHIVKGRRWKHLTPRGS